MTLFTRENRMSLCMEGMNSKIKGAAVTIRVEDRDPLIRLGNMIDWTILQDLASEDLKKTEKGFWWMGRNLYVRVHLGAMILQMLFKWTDRLTEAKVRTTPLYQIFCGLNILRKWRCPDHTKIEEFRNRLSSKTHKDIADYIVKLSVDLGFGDPTILDVDSTVQEANMSYPSDATLMRKLSSKCKKLLDFLREKQLVGVESLQINLTWIVKKYQEYIFLAKNTVKAKRQEVFRELHTFVQKELRDFVKYVECLPRDFIESLPWNYLDIAKLISEDARRYLLDVGHFVMTGCMKKNKILSLKLRDVVCVKKGKLGKEKEFGRVFQLGRIGGNFLVPYFCTSLRMDDKENLPQVILEHLFLFNPKGPLSVATDKGYYSGYNIEFVKEMTGNADGIQRPANVKDQGGLPRIKELFNRRAGVEPLIGHAKRFGLGKSMMKSDEATLASGYRSVTGFNLHQLMRNLEGTSRLSTA